MSRDRKGMALSVIAIGVAIILIFELRERSRIEVAPRLNSGVYVEYIEAKIKKMWRNTEGIWPGTDFNNHNLVLFEIGKEDEVLNAWCLNTEGKKVLGKEEYKLIEVPLAGGFSEIEFEGKESIAISFDKWMVEFYEKEGFDFIYPLTTHELVHFYYQDKIGEVGTRYTKFPQDYRPRLYRTMIYRNLGKAYENKGLHEEYMGKAKYWYDKWVAEYPAEYRDIKATDILEGHARYFEYFATGTYQGMDSKKKEEFLKSKINLDEYFTAMDIGSYELGYVAGLALDEVKPGWKKTFIKSNKTMLEILFEGRESIVDNDYGGIEAKLRDEIEKLNVKNSKRIHKTVKSIKDVNTPYLKIDAKYSTGSEESEEFLDYNGSRLIVGLNSLYKNDDEGIKFSGVNVIEEKDDKSRFRYFPLDVPYTLKGSEMILSNENSTGSFKVTLENDAKGRTVYIFGGE